ncbi:hypothetical protein BANRA_03678 [Escherichia coli]|nr:hypothetical protein BANRA_03678 [Escherichia coli]
MMSECKYHEGNAFVIMGAGEQLKRIKYDANENKLKYTTYTLIIIKS